MVSFVSETRKLQRASREDIQRILAEQERLNSEVEKWAKKIERWSKELNKREALTDRERQRLEEERKKVTLVNHLSVTCVQQVTYSSWSNTSNIGTDIFYWCF